MKKQIRATALILGMATHSLVAQQTRQTVYEEPVYEAAWSQPTVMPDRIILSLGADPSSTAGVNWRTNTDIKLGFAQLAEARSEPKFWRESQLLPAHTELLDATAIKEASVKANNHSVKFTNLKSNTLYAYRVGDGKHWSEWFQFRTASAKPEKFSFLYVGDAQNNILELWSRLIRKGFQTLPDARFIVHAGDLVSTANDNTQWQEWFSAGSFIHAMVPSVAVPGNHEYFADKEGKKRNLTVFWRPQFNLPDNGPEGMKENVYYMDYQGVRIIALDSNNGAENTAMLQWLENVLKNNPNRWTILTFHHPVFSGSEGRDNKEWRIKIQPLINKYKVDLVLQGHDHTYARGRVPYQDENTMSGINTKDFSGAVYVVSVSGGKMYNLRPNAWEGWEAKRERAGENTQLFQTVTVDRDLLSFQSYTATGDLYDSFELRKDGSGRNKFIDMKSSAIPERYHHNTIPYEDELPNVTRDKVLAKFPGFKIDNVNAVYDKNKSLNYRLKLVKDKTAKRIVVDANGQLISEE